MLPSLTDGSTETFWESGDEDRNKTKWISLKISGNQQARSVAVHLDNGRDIANKVGSLTFKCGKTQDDLMVLKTVETENRFAGWVTCFLNEGNCDYVRVEIKGPDNTVRLRQVKVIGKVSDLVSPGPPERAESQRIQVTLAPDRDQHYASTKWRLHLVEVEHTVQLSMMLTA